MIEFSWSTFSSNFFVGYYNDVKLITSLFRIARRYFFTFFLFDVIATLPSLCSYQESSIYFLKLLRFVRLAHVVAPITAIVERLNIDKMLKRQMKAFIRLMIILFSIIHILAWLWVFIGRHQSNSWIEVKRPTERFDKDANIYIAAIYFIVVTLATVGYGDFIGNTVNEYINFETPEQQNVIESIIIITIIKDTKSLNYY